ncbi:MAG: hypothetical protein GEU99_15355 [Luteitalea sp.]|nr:hypothetical protein [Luteitalea sp.]
MTRLCRRWARHSIRGIRAWASCPWRRVDRRARMAWLCVLCIYVGASACGGDGRGAEAEFEARPGAQRFALAGRVVSVEASERKATVEHDEVEGLMEAMTMQFLVKEQWALQAMAPGDRITATLVVDGARSWLQNVVVTRTGGAGDAESGEPVSPPGAPAPGTRLPELLLVDQDQRSVGESDFTDRVSVVTFIYTRCPLPDYCPLMMRRLNQTARELQARPDEAPHTQFLPVSVDPEYDTPAVLRQYAGEVVAERSEQPPKTGRATVTWRFLTGEPENVRAFAGFFGLVYEQQGDEIMHALRTAVIDPQGRVAVVLRGNEWTATDLLRHIDAANGSSRSAAR